MPCYNSLSFIEDSLLSVINQTYSDWELIVIDDGSTDGTLEFLNKYTKNNKIKLYRNTLGKGVSYARQHGINMSNGRYIAFLDSDDLWHKDKLRKQVAFLSENNIGFTYSDYAAFKNSVDDVIFTRVAPNTINYKRLCYNCPIGNSSVMLDMYLLGDIKIPNIPKEDYALWLTLLEKGNVAKKSPSTLMFYRIGHSSTSNQKFKEIFRQYNVLRTIGKKGKIASLYFTLIYMMYGIYIRINKTTFPFLTPQ